MKVTQERLRDELFGLSSSRRQAISLVIHAIGLINSAKNNFPIGQLKEELSGNYSNDVAQLAISILHFNELIEFEEGMVCLPRTRLRVEQILATVFGDSIPKSNLIYQARQARISDRGVKFGKDLIRIWRRCSSVVNSALSSKRSELGRHSIQWKPIRGDLLRLLIDAVDDKEETVAIIELFIDAGEAIGQFAPDTWNREKLSIIGHCDTDYFLSEMFGLKTDIPGFDKLFGGGLLAATPKVGQRWLGRTIVVRGERGSGKSIFGSQMAFEVAAKGGLAFIFALEQHIDDLKNQFHSFGWPSSAGCVICDSPGEFIRTVEVMATTADFDSGVLGIGALPKDSIEEHYQAIEELARRLPQYKFPLSLFVIDPINAVGKGHSISESQLRSQCNDFFEFIKRRNICCLMIGEADQGTFLHTQHEENTADYVVKLTSEETGSINYTQRFIEIAKSRGQPTHRGRHPFSIRKGSGISIYPSCASSLAERKRRIIKAEQGRISTGVPELDRALGGGLTNGDVTIYRGTGASCKTEFALLYLLAPSLKRQGPFPNRISIFITFNETVDAVRTSLEKSNYLFKTLKRSYDEYGISLNRRSLWQEKLRVISLSPGYVRPGEILQRLESEIQSLRIQGVRVDRVVVDNVRLMEDSCPIISGDPAFVPALLNLITTEGCTPLFVCSRREQEDQPLQQALADAAHCVVDFRSVYLQGKRRIAVNVSKTRLKDHDTSVFGVRFDARIGLCLTEEFGLLKNVMTGSPEPIPVRLFLHDDTSLQEKYHERVRLDLEHKLGTKVSKSDVDYLGGENVSPLRAYSGLEELQIVELDEYQANMAGSSALKRFPVSGDQFSNLLGTCDEERLNCISDGKEFWGVPYLGNASILVYDSSESAGVNPSMLKHWTGIARLCEKRPEEIVFGFPADTDEHINCLFLEIFFSRLLMKGRMSTPSERLAVNDLFRQRSILIESLKIFWRVGHLAYQSNAADQSGDIGARSGGRYSMSSGIVWRHWFTTFEQMVRSHPVAETHNIRVTSLPGQLTTAGDWYLGVSRTSAYPEIGLEIISYLTSPGASAERLRDGVGLTVVGGEENRERFRHISGMWDIDAALWERVYSSAIKRSKLDGYVELTHLLSGALRWLLSVRLSDEVSSAVEDIASELSAYSPTLG